MNAATEEIKPVDQKKEKLSYYLLMGVFVALLVGVAAFMYKQNVKMLEPAPRPIAAFELKNMAMVNGGVPEGIAKKARENPEALTMEEYKAAALLTNNACSKLPQIPDDLRTACATASALAAHFAGN
jgi:hypothetical protein